MRWYLAILLANLGEAYAAAGEVQQSARCWYESLKLALEACSPPEIIDALVGVAGVILGEGDGERAAELLMVALGHPTLARVTREKAQRLLAPLTASLSQPVLAVVRERAAGLAVEALAAELLRARRDAMVTPRYAP